MKAKRGAAGAIPPIFEYEDELPPVTADDVASPTQVDALSPGDFTQSQFQRGDSTVWSGIYVPEWVIDVTRTRAELLVVAQLAYWLGIGKNGKPRATHRRDGFLWVWKSYGQFAKETRLTRDGVRGAIRSLKARVILLDAGDHTRHGIPYYRLCPIAIATALATGELVTSACDEEEFDV